MCSSGQKIKKKSWFITPKIYFYAMLFRLEDVKSFLELLSEGELSFDFEH